MLATKTSKLSFFFRRRSIATSSKTFKKTATTTMASGDDKVVVGIDRLADGPMHTQDPFLFCVYHKDQ